MSELEIRTSNSESITVEADTEAVLNQDTEVTANEESKEESVESTEQATEQQPESTETQQVELDRQIQQEEAIKAELVSKGIDFEALSQEYQEKGELSEQSVKLLEDKGYPKALIDSYIDNLNMRAEMFVNTVLSHAGGEQAFGNLKEFVKAQGEEAQDAFNAVLQTGNLALIKAHITGIQAQMGQAYGTQKPTIMGVGEVSQGTSLGYESKEQLVEAMSDKRYGHDKKYTEEVQKKVINSNLF